MTESWFAVLGAVVLVTALIGAVAASAATPDVDAGGVEDWSADVPDPHDAEEPAGAGTATVLPADGADDERGADEDGSTTGDDNTTADGTDTDRTFDSVQAAVDAADPGETVVLEGRFDERVTIDTPDLTVEASERDAAVIDGGGEDDVVRIDAANVTVEGVWIRNSGYDLEDADSGVTVEASNATLSALRLTEIQFGVWVGNASDVTVEDSLVAGREEVRTTRRGNGIHLWEVTDVDLANNSVTDVRDGLYYQWAEGVVAEDNAVWDARYGVHYMYSNDNRLEGNVAFDNDVGYALMVSYDLTMRENVAVDNDGTSGHGILLKDVEDSEVVGNEVVGNGNGLYVYNAQDNRLADNLVLENDVGVHVAAGSSGQVVTGNSFVANDQAAFAETNAQVAWNGTERGNHWDDARTVDRDGDGVGETRHQPAGTVERLVHERPETAVFADSPAFDAVRMAESSFPVVETPGVVDHRPLADPQHDSWREYYANHDH